MRVRLCLFAAVFSLQLLAAPPAESASGYDVSDLWWVATESGWGVQFVQQRETVFATLYAYDGANAPRWYVATLDFLGLEAQTRAARYAGDLYETTGPWFGSPVFNPAAVGRRKVGTLDLRSENLTEGTLTYVIDGVTVVKRVERETLRIDDYAASYSGSFVIAASKCTNPADNGTRVLATTFVVSQAGTAVTLTGSFPGFSCTYSGTLTQHGRVAEFGTAYTCTSGEVGTLFFNEVNVQRFGLMGRLFGINNAGCHIEGSFAGARN